jgi:hypothetical protein
MLLKRILLKARSGEEIHVGVQQLNIHELAMFQAVKYTVLLFMSDSFDM